MLKNPTNDVEVAISRPWFLSLPNVSRVICILSAPGGKRGNLKQGSTISLGMLQYIRHVNRRPYVEEEEEEGE
jgi:hypothetical protein